MTDISIVPIDRLDLRLEPRPWTFAIERRPEIDAHFTRLKQDKPALWNGRVLLLHDCSVSHAVLHGSYFETDFASVMAWRDWGYPDPAVRTCFAMAALQARDGAFLLGVMGDHTANAGQIYFPTGNTDLDDVCGNKVSLDRSVRRELAEETGLTLDELQAEPGWHAVFAGPHIAMIKLARTSETADELRARIVANLASQPEPEFSDIRIVNGPADLDSRIPPYVRAFLHQIWRGLHR
jgi:8-oxo-dGTP pyrophosphatase MutT (NUDIX family)